MGTLKIGDRVLDAEGKSTRVTYVSPILLANNTYKVVFSDGSVILADAEHLWEVFSLRHAKPHVLTTETIKASLADCYQIAAPAVKGNKARIVTITAILSADPVQMRCIAVDNPRHLYLAGKSCIPTHNTLTGEIKELHRALTRKNYPILIACPAKSQSKKWFDDICTVIDNDPDLRGCVAQRQQQPFYLIRFLNGSSISIFTTGSESGRKGDTVRSQSPRRVRLDEQDLLNPDDYKALQPLWRRYKDSEFHGSSTPTGARSMFWEMCTQFRDYKELHFPIMVHPDWGPEMEEACKREARIQDVYDHEYLAVFGDLEGGVFKTAHIDAARRDYDYFKCVYNPDWKYFMGVDWNGQGTGTRIRIVGYDPQTRIRCMVAGAAIDQSVQASIQKIREMNRAWHCEKIYVDAGFGFVQDELLRLEGYFAKNEDDRRLLDIKVIDFGANISTNRLVPRRGNDKYIGEKELERRTKPFMVEGAAMALEQNLFIYSSHDKLLDDQFRAYKVKTWSSHGYANTYDSGNVGDHDLDATMLALLAIELNYGLFYDFNNQRRGLSLSHIPGIGMPAIAPTPHQGVPTTKEAIKSRFDIPTRDMTAKPNEPTWRAAAISRTSYIAVPNNRQNSPIRRFGSMPSLGRTSVFRGQPPSRGGR